MNSKIWCDDMFPFFDMILLSFRIGRWVPPPRFPVNNLHAPPQSSHSNLPCRHPLSVIPGEGFFVLLEWRLVSEIRVS